MTSETTHTEESLKHLLRHKHNKAMEKQMEKLFPTLRFLITSNGWASSVYVQELEEKKDIHGDSLTLGFGIPPQQAEDRIIKMVKLYFNL